MCLLSFSSANPPIKHDQTSNAVVSAAAAAAVCDRAAGHHRDRLRAHRINIKRFYQSIGLREGFFHLFW